MSFETISFFFFSKFECLKWVASFKFAKLAERPYRDNTARFSPLFESSRDKVFANPNINKINKLKWEEKFDKLKKALKSVACFVN